MAHDNGAPPGLLMEGPDLNCIGIHRVREIVFEETEVPVGPSETIDTWDVSAARDGSVTAWMRNDRCLHVTTSGHGPVVMPANCSFMFRFFEQMERCDLSGSYMGEVATARSMFYGCVKLKEVVLPRSFPKEANTENMFIYCRELEANSRPEQVSAPTAYHNPRL